MSDTTNTVIREPIAVVEIFRLNKWWEVKHVYVDSNFRIDEIKFAEDLGEVQALRVRYLNIEGQGEN